MPSVDDLARVQAYSDVSEALSRLARKHGTKQVREIARSWVGLMDRAEEISRDA